MTKIPCKTCLKFPICKTKHFIQCDDMYDHLYYAERSNTDAFDEAKAYFSLLGKQQVWIESNDGVCIIGDYKP